MDITTNIEDLTVEALRKAQEQATVKRQLEQRPVETGEDVQQGLKDLRSYRQLPDADQS